MPALHNVYSELPIDVVCSRVRRIGNNNGKKESEDKVGR
jgi:hypothetical protein